MEIYLIRHTAPLIDNGVCYGHSDIPVKDPVQQEVLKIIKLLPKNIDIIYSSPLIRCSGLAQYIPCKQPVHIDRRLMEMNFGNWEMKKWDDINPHQLSFWMSNFVHSRVPGGESFKELSIRVNHFIDTMLLPSNYKTVAITTHAGVIRSFLCYILELPLKKAFKIPCNYSGISKIRLNKESCYNSIEYIDNVIERHTSAPK